jgi:hypothetical protein
MAERDTAAFANTETADKKQTWLQANGLVCKASFTTALVPLATNSATIKASTTLKDASYTTVDGQTVTFCDRLSSTTSPLYKAKADADTIRAPLSNVDNLKRVLTKA